MKTLLTLTCTLLLTLSTFASAEVCTSVIKDRSGYEFETFTRTDYSQAAACDQALFDCRNALSMAQSYGRYYDAICEIKYNQPNPYPRPNPNPLVCQTDMMDYYGKVVRTFSAPGATEYEACGTSDNFCKVELARNNSYGFTCVNRGLINNRQDPRPPRRDRTEQCMTNRRDPAGMFIQSYLATATGPEGTDVLGEACRLSMNDCSRDIRGRQTCTITR